MFLSNGIRAGDGWRDEYIGWQQRHYQLRRGGSLRQQMKKMQTQLELLGAAACSCAPPSPRPPPHPPPEPPPPPRSDPLPVPPPSFNRTDTSPYPLQPHPVPPLFLLIRLLPLPVNRPTTARNPLLAAAISKPPLPLHCIPPPSRTRSSIPLNLPTVSLPPFHPLLLLRSTTKLPPLRPLLLRSTTKSPNPSQAYIHADPLPLQTPFLPLQRFQSYLLPPLTQAPSPPYTQPCHPLSRSLSPNCCNTYHLNLSILRHDML